MEELIAKICREELGETPKNIEKAGEGLVHQTYSIVVESGEYIIQIAEDDEKASSLEICLNLYRMFSDSEVPVPATVTGKIHEFDGRKYIVVEKIEGEMIGDSLTPEKVQESAKYLAKIHNFRSLEKSGWPYFEQGKLKISGFNEGSMEKYMLKNVEEKAEVFEKKGRERLAALVREFFEKHGDSIPENFQPVICHNDYAPDNLLFKENELKAIIDWDYAYSGHHQRDLVKAANSFWVYDPEADWEIRDTFYEAYNQHRDIGEDFEALRPIYRVETLIRIVASLATLDAWEDRNGEYLADRLEEVIEENI